MSAAIDDRVREDLLDRAGGLLDLLAKHGISPNDAGSRAATALAVLRSDGADALFRMLGMRLPGRAGRTWDRFGRHALPTLQQVNEEHGAEGVAFVLGWVKRLGKMRRRS